MVIFTADHDVVGVRFQMVHLESLGVMMVEGYGGWFRACPSWYPNPYNVLHTMTTDVSIALFRYFSSVLACRLFLMLGLSGSEWSVHEARKYRRGLGIWVSWAEKIWEI